MQTNLCGNYLLIFLFAFFAQKKEREQLRSFSLCRSAGGVAKRNPSITIHSLKLNLYGCDGTHA